MEISKNENLFLKGFKLFRSMNKFYLIAFLFVVSIGYSQQISGIVLDSESDLPIPGATVLVKGTTIGTNTDFDGNFSLDNVSKGDILVVSSIGFVTQEVVVDSQLNYVVILNEDVETLDEVIVMGYGTQLKKEVTGAVSIVGSETIEKVKPTRVEQALQGQVAGVNITSQSGSPGGGLDIRIRGISTNGDNRPLILVDGNVIEELSVLNPSDIASITVLKDASAGIYGTRASNGVILITTKIGRRSTPLKFEYNNYFGFQETTRILPVLNATEYSLLTNESFAAGGKQIPYPTIADLGQGTNWQKEVFQKAPITNHDISVRGGGDKSTYSIGFSAFDQDGIVGGDKASFKRLTGRINYNVELFDNFNLKANFIYANTQRKTLPENSIGSLLYNAINMPPTLTPYDDNGDFTRATDLGNEVVNPLKQKDLSLNLTTADRFSGVFGLKYDILPELNVEANYQANYTEVFGQYFSPTSDYGAEGVFGDKVFDREAPGYYQPLDIYRDYTVDILVNYEQEFAGKHDVKFTLGNSIFRTFADGFGVSAEGLPNIDRIEDVRLGDASIVTPRFINVDNRFSDSRLLSYFSRVRYSYDDKYYLTAVVRRDASSNFGPGNSIGSFPTASIGWILSEENFLSNSNLFDFLKFKASYGFLGNDRIGSFLYTSTLSGEGVYVFDNQIVYGVAPGSPSNPNVKWEEQEALNLGVEMRLFNDHVNLGLDYFKRRTNDLLLLVETSRVVGVSAPGSGAPIANAGSVENSGIEIEFGYQDTFFNELDFGLNFNFSTLDNVVTEVNNQIGYEIGGGFGIGGFEGPSRMEVGYPIGYFYGLQTDGIFQSVDEVDAHASQRSLGSEAVPGDFRYVNQNGDDKIDEDDRVYLGDPIPDYTMGLNISLDYKNIDFSAYAFASLGSEIVRNYERNLDLTNKPAYKLNRWRGIGTSDTDPRVTTAANSNSRFSDYFVEDGSYLRVQNIQIGYTFSDENSKLDILKPWIKASAESIRFYASVGNAFTLTNYKGFDPTTSTGSPVGGGFDQGFYPNPRTYSVGFNIKF